MEEARRFHACEAHLSGPYLCIGGPMHGRLWNSDFISLPPLGYAVTTIRDPDGIMAAELLTSIDIADPIPPWWDFISSRTEPLLPGFDTHEEQSKWVDWQRQLEHWYGPEAMSCASPDSDRCRWPRMPVIESVPGSRFEETETGARLAEIELAVQDEGFHDDPIKSFAQKLRLWRELVVESREIAEDARADMRPVSRELSLPELAGAIGIQHREMRFLASINQTVIDETCLMFNLTVDLTPAQYHRSKNYIDLDYTDAIRSLAEDIKSDDRWAYIRMTRFYRDDAENDVVCVTEKIADHLCRYHAVRLTWDEAKARGDWVRRYHKDGWRTDPDWTNLLSNNDKLKRATALRSLQSEAA